MRAALIKAFGEPTEVLELADVPEPLGPAAGEVLVGVEYAPVNMNDLYVIQGAFLARQMIEPHVHPLARGRYCILPEMAWGLRPAPGRLSTVVARPCRRPNFSAVDELMLRTIRSHRPEMQHSCRRCSNWTNKPAT